MHIVGDMFAKAEWLYQDRSILSVIRAGFSDGSLSMVLYRTMRFLSSHRFTMIFAYLFNKVNSVLCGCVIGVNASFGEDFIILHSTGIVINSDVKGKNGIIIESGVVIGAEKRKSPMLGSNIFIGSGAKILGSISVGNNVTIGANAVVVKNVPDNVVVAGVPARIIKERTIIQSE
jgi:serine O-acetyltransferase